MTASSRQVLKQLVDEQGMGLLEDRRRVRAFLMDLLVGRPREQFWLISALDHGVVTKLQETASGNTQRFLIDNVVRQFHEDSGFPLPVAQWVVGSWAAALGLDVGQQDDAPPPERTAGGQVLVGQGPDATGSLAAAVRSAAVGDTIRLAPGVYRDQVVVRSGVEIVADGPLGSVTWQADTHPALVWQSAFGGIQGVVFSSGRTGTPAVTIEQGEPLVTGCRFEGTGEGLTVSGLAAPKVEGCDFLTEGTALSCNEESQPRVEGSRFDGQRDSAIEARDASFLSLVKNKIAGGSGVGILFRDAASGTMVGNEVADLEGGGVLLEGQSGVTSSGNVVTATNGSGLLMRDRSAGEFANDAYTDNQGSGIEVTSTGAPRFERMIANGNHVSGIWVHADGTGVWRKCDFRENDRFGVSVSKGANPTVSHCRITDNGDSGIYVFKEGRGLFDGNEVARNQQFGVAIAEEGNPDLRNTSVHGNGSSGVGVYAKGKGQFSLGTIRKNEGSGVAVFGEGEVAVKDCEIVENGEYGVFLDQTASGSIHGCEIRGNELGSWLVMPGAKTSRRRNRDS